MKPLGRRLLDWRVRRFRGLHELYGPLIIVVVFLLATHHLYGVVKKYHSDANLRAAKSAAQGLRALQQSDGLRRCFASMTDGKEMNRGLCTHASHFLASLQAAGLVLPLSHLGKGFQHQGICAGGCFVATNIRDAQYVMPNYIHNLVLALGTLTHFGNSAFVSVYESGSKDHTTDWLQVLADVLDALG